MCPSYDANSTSPKWWAISILVLVLSLPSFAVTIDVWLQHTNEEMKILREITDKFTEKKGE